MKNLKELRKEIDALDDVLVKTYLERLSVVKEIANAKKTTKQKVYNKKREREVINRLSKKKTPAEKNYIKELYKKIFARSKKIQKEIMKG